MVNVPVQEEEFKGPYRPFEQTKFRGLNKDIIAENLPPELFKEMVNRRIGKNGIVEVIAGCSLIKDIGANIGSVGVFFTEGEDYVFIHETTNNKILVYTLEDSTLTAYNKWDNDSSNIIEIYNPIADDYEDLVMTEKVWFAPFLNELYFGNMSEGTYRFSPGNQNIMRGSAPLDIIAEAEVESESGIDKSYSEWLLAYDYEYKGGRSPLSRYARVRLYNLKQQIKVTMDTPPDISKNRRIYAKFNSGTDDDPSWSDWYFIKEVDDYNQITVTLDSELMDRITTDGYKYSEHTAKAVCPKARIGVVSGERLLLANTVESPTIVRPSEVGKPYFNENMYFDLGDFITNAVDYRDYTIVSTIRRIFALHDIPKHPEVLANEGAFEGTLQIRDGTPIWFNSKKFRYLEKVGEVKSLPGMETVNLGALQHEKRHILFSKSREFEEGNFSGGISPDFRPGALSLQPNLFLVRGGGVLEAMWNRDTSDTIDTVGTSTHEFFFQPFIFEGDAGQTFTAEKLAFFMNAYNTDGEDGFGGFIAPDDPENPGKPDLDPENTLAEFFGKVNGRPCYKRIFDLSTRVEFDVDTLYHIVIPGCGDAGADWQISFREDEGVGGDENPLYPNGEWFQYSEDGESWSNFTHGGNNTILDFQIIGYGDRILLSPEHWLLFSGDSLPDSDDYDYAMDITPDINCAVEAIEIAVKNKSPSEDPTITVESDSDGDPSGTPISTASDFTHPGQRIIRAELGGEAITAKTRIWVRVHATSASDYDYCAAESAGNTIGKRSDDGGSTWDDYSDILWCKLYVTPTAQAEWAADGVWEGPVFNIGVGNSLKKIFSSFNQPTGAGIKIEFNGYDDSETGWTGYQTLYDTTGANSDDNLPYDIVSNLGADISRGQIKVTLELGTASYTPIVDSVLIFYEKSGDNGDKLHSGIVNGAYYLSVEDYDGDSSDEYTYVFDTIITPEGEEFGHWHELDRAFYGYLPVSEKHFYGIGKNPNETYRNLYDLDAVDSNGNKISSWYYGDTTPVDIDANIESGKILYGINVKIYREFRIYVRSKGDSTLYVNAWTGGAERSLDIIGDFSEYLSIEDTNGEIKTYYFSLPADMQGKWFAFSIETEGSDLDFIGYKLNYATKICRRVSFSIDTIPTIKEIATFQASAIYHPVLCAFYGNELFGIPANSGSGTAKLRRWSINPITGEETLLKEVSCPTTLTDNYCVRVTADYVYISTSLGFWIFDHDFTLVGKKENVVTNGGRSQFCLSAGEKYAWMTAEDTDEKKVCYIDLSDKTTPISGIAASGKQFFAIARYGDYLFIGYKDGSNSYINVYDASTPTSLTLLDTLAVGYQACYQAIIIDESLKKAYYLNTGTDSPQIIDISDLEDLSILSTGSSAMNGELFVRRNEYLFVCKDLGATVGFRVVDTDDDSLSLGRNYVNPTSFNVTSSEGIAYNGGNLLIAMENNTNLVHVWRVYG